VKQKLKVPYLTVNDIEAAAQKVRNQHKSLEKTPIDVLGFAEFDLGLEFDFAPVRQIGQDAFLRPDRTGILFDKWAFNEPSMLPRVRFSAAHELGHFFLHQEIYGKLEFTSIPEWKKFVGSIPAQKYQWIEWQAEEFAGRFLMPSAELSNALDEAMVDAEREGYLEQGPEDVLEFCAKSIRKDFGVSFSAMQTRIRRSGLWPHIKVQKREANSN
jgi:hypothetical protein